VARRHREPVPDVIEALGWTGGESVSDGRALLHYTRTTRDGRIVFGWAGGRMGAGARTGRRMEVDHAVAVQARRDLLRFFPMLEGRPIAHAWGGPIDVSPTHLPVVASLPGMPGWAAFGYTGNGVGPSHLLGRTLAALALDRRDAVTRLPFVDGPLRRVPPEPLRVAGATVLRRALVRKEAAEEAGGRADRVTRTVADLPRRLGLHIVR
jgi:glycine/D-amino acid oxidase-like deaminating enzyme